MSEFDDFEKYDNDWGNDPFDGDMDFDMDFDNPGGKKGFLRSAVSGFLDGIVERTIGSTDSRVHTLQSILPDSWNPTFRNLRDFNSRRREMIEEMKNDSFTTVEDLQYLAQRAAKAAGEKLPNKISAGLTEFSKRDFFDWEKKDYSADDQDRLEDTSDEDVKALINNEDANAVLSRETVKSVGKQTIGMMTEIGGRSIAGLHNVAATGMRTNQLLEHLLDYQRRVQQRNDQLMISLTARQYLTAAKYYKFQEASNHRMVTELKQISQYVQMSDYEKTTTSQALKRNLRETVFNTVKSRFGGIADYLQEKVGKDARQDAASSMSDITSSLRMVAEMTEGMPINVGSMLGNAAAGVFLNNLPKIIASGKGQAYLAKFKKQFPKLAKWADDAYIRIGDLGNVASYVTSNAEELANSLGKHYQGGFHADEDATYEDYVDSLPAGTKPAPKAVWTIAKTGRKLGNKTASSVFDNMWEASNTQFSLSKRSLADGHEVALWSRRDSRTLTEEIPRWFSMVHLSLEKIRTGNDALKPMHYDYAKDRFITENKKIAVVTNAIFDKNQFQSQANSANNLAKSIDEGGVLSKKAKEALAFQLAKDSDKKLGFNPYNFFNLEADGHSKEVSEEIKRNIMATFGITDEHIDEFLNGDDVTRARMMSYMPTEKGRRLLPAFADQSRSLSTFMPDIANNLDIHKNSGFYDAMKKAGIITQDKYSGEDEISDAKFWDTLKKFIANPDAKHVVPEPKDEAPDPTRAFGSFTPPPTPAPTPIPPFILGGSVNPAGKPGEPITVKVIGFEDLLKQMDGFKDLASKLSLSGEAFKGANSLDITPLNNSMDLLVKNTGDLLQLAQVRNETLLKIQEGIPKRKKKTADEENDLRSGTNRIMDKIKEFSFKDFYNKAVDTVLRNEPLILGGLLGGLAGYALHNPKAAALIGAGALAATAYGKFRGMAKARTPEDTEDLYEEGSDEPILEARRLREGQYYDLTKNKIINSWKEISGSVKIVSTDAYNGTVIGARKLAKKLFTAENKEVFLSGLNKIREWLGKAFNFIDPVGRAMALKDKVANRFFQMDVYKEGAKTPTLLGKSFAGGAYYKMNADGKAEVLKGWNDIDGPVYDREGNMLISQEDYDRGLVTSMGVSINKMGAAARKVSAWGLKALGIAKDKAAEYAGKAYDKSKDMMKSDYSPIVNAVDRIYYLLLEHWGYKIGHMPQGMSPPPAVDITKGVDPDVPGPAPEEVQKREEKDQNPEGAQKLGFSERIREKIAELTGKAPEKGEPPKKGERLNSLKDQAAQKDKKKSEKVKDAIISIASNFGFGGEKKKPEKAGLFGMLASMIGGTVSVLGGIATFFTKSLWGSMKVLTTFASLGLKVLPVMATGITAIAKGIFTLLRTKSLTEAGTSVLDTIMDNKDEHPEVRKKRKEDRAAHRRKPGTKFKGAGLGLGLGMVAGDVTANMVETGMIEEDGLADHVGSAVGTAATAYGAWQLASGVAAVAGVELGAVATTAAVAGGTMAWAGISAAGAAILPVLLNPYVLAGVAVLAVGYGLYKLFEAGKGSQLKMRLSQYGVSDVESDLAEKVMKAEQTLEKFVVIGNGRASISKDAPLGDVFKLFLTNPKDKAEVAEVFTWFNGRFKPVYLTYMACLDAAKFKGLEAYDESTDQTVYATAKQAHSALGGVMPYPYSVVAKIDPDTPIMAEKQTVIRVNGYLQELKKYVDRKTDKEDLAPVALPGSVASLQKEKKDLEEKIALGGDAISSETAQKRVDTIDKQLSALNSSFKIGKQVQAVFIKDLLPDDRPMDLLTAIRVACYGNDEDMTWRVEAVLRLERFCEPLFVLSGSEVVFRGDIGELFGIFRTAFRLKSDQGEEWAKWFRDRFAPVMRNYVQLVSNYRKGNPGVVWRSLSVTARYEIAMALTQTMVHITDSIITPIWNVRASPFEDSRSPDKPDKVDRMLKILAEASTTAKLRDPEKEAGKTNTSSWAKAISPHKVGGGYTEKAANVQNVDQYKSRKDVALGGQYGTNVTRGAGTGNIYSINGNYGTPQNQYGYKALTGDSDTSHLDMSKVMKDTGGKDTGVKIPRKLAEQLIIREMLKQGFTDPRAIAEVLALSNYETGGYSRTVENLKYSDPQRLMKLFKEVTTLDQARQLVQLGEVAIGNTVYGGAKGRQLGNVEEGDGYKFRGRGMFQHTGRANYTKLSQALGIDLVSKPELLSEDPNVMAMAAVDFYKNSKLLTSITQDGDFGRAARGLNGGNALPGMPDRYRMYLSYLDQLSKGELKADEESATAASQDVVGSAPVGSSGSGPMIGTPAGAPPLGASPSGGSLYGGAPSGGGGSYGTPAGNYSGGPGAGSSLPGGAPIITSGASNNAGLRLKSSEAVAGGDAHPGVKRMAQLVQTNVPTFKQITAMNDLYHKQKKPNSKHARGLALDFTLTDGVRSSDQAVSIAKTILQQAGLNPNEFLVLNEYKKMSAGATGGHIHVGFNTTAAADKFAQASGANAQNGQDTTAGGGPVQPQAEVQSPPQMGVEAEEPRGMAAPEAGPAGGGSAVPGKRPNIPGPKPGQEPNQSAPSTPDPYGTSPGAPYQQPRGPSNQQPQQQSAPQQQAAPAVGGGGEVEKLLAQLIAAVNEQGGANVGLLGKAIEQLGELNKNSKAPAARITV